MEEMEELRQKVDANSEPLNVAGKCQGTNLIVLVNKGKQAAADAK